MKILRTGGGYLSWVAKRSLQETCAIDRGWQKITSAVKCDDSTNFQIR